jgi:hypothetical protein
MLKQYKNFAFALVFVLIANILQAKPDQGMWIPMFIKKYNETTIKKLGAKLSADDIYDINKASIKVKRRK